MKIIKGYISEILFRTKRNLLQYILSLIILALIMTLTAFIGLKIIGIQDTLLKSFLVGLVSVFPAIGSGLIMIPWIIVRLITKNIALAGQLAIVYIILIIVKQVLEPYINGSKYSIRPLITVAIFLIGYIFGRLTGAIITSFLLLIIATLFEVLDIQNYARWAKRRKRKEGKL
ncbi:MAG: AI-2E family transporter [Miniphocaeibacter sp.]|uniref:AI-2E family transporter n=1 Tax=Miniphocaeibacter sp. TaxID=3100973 RepID=UPI003BB19DBC